MTNGPPSCACVSRTPLCGSASFDVICVNVRVQRGSRGRRSTEETRRDDLARGACGACGDERPGLVDDDRRWTEAVLGESTLLDPPLYHATLTWIRVRRDLDPFSRRGLPRQLVAANCHVSRNSRLERALPLPIWPYLALPVRISCARGRVLLVKRTAGARLTVIRQRSSLARGEIFRGAR